MGNELSCTNIEYLEFLHHQKNFPFFGNFCLLWEDSHHCGHGRDNQTQFGFHHHPHQWKLLSRTWQFIIHYLGIKEFHNRFRVVIAPF